MSLMEWGPEYEIGIKDIDMQHEKLVNIINQLNKIIVNNKSSDKIRMVLTELLDYTSYHFKTEEDIMDKIKYPEADRHKFIHKRLLDSVKEFTVKFNAGQPIADDLMIFLKHWLSAHIKHVDRKIADFYN